MKKRRLSRPVKLLMVDDHTLVRAGTRVLLEATGQIAVIGEAPPGKRRWSSGAGTNRISC